MTTVLVLAPHPDDEVLGVGGTMAKHLAAGDAVHVAICTRGREERFGVEQVERVLAEARAAHALLGITESHFLDLPAAELDTVAATEINGAISGLIEQVRPDVLYLAHPGDVHQDHQILFQAAMVAVRPVAGRLVPRRILAYETVSETDWYAAPITPAFVPQVFVDISNHLEQKLAACACYASQMRPAPDQRSAEALRALATTRGHAMGLPAAEAFVLVREMG
jgi:LmbE family N-acetylglucosaminyl deacetylase